MNSIVGFIVISDDLPILVTSETDYKAAMGHVDSQHVVVFSDDIYSNMVKEVVIPALLPSN